MNINNNNISVIGSEWLYLKIYIGESFADKLLSEILNICKQLFKIKSIDKWFFIRYYDPKFHIRVRFHLMDFKNLHHVIEIVNNNLSKYLINSLIENMQIDTYVKEIDRYGGNKGVILAENLFCADSLIISEFLSSFEQNTQKEEYRWQFGLENIDRFMSDFNFNIEMKINFINNFISYFKGDFKKDKYLNKQFDIKFKKNLEEINAIIKDKKDDFFEYLFNKRYNIYRPFILDINREVIKGTINKQIPDLLVSYIHMSCNRLFRTEQIRHEFTLYNLLVRFYKREFYLK